MSSEQEAQQCAQKYPVGRVFADGETDIDKLPFMRDFFRKILDRNALSVFSVGIDPDTSLPGKVVVEAGIEDSFLGPLGTKVIEALGNGWIDEIYARYGPVSGHYLAMFEYAWSQLPRSSAAYLACQYYLQAEVLDDMHAAGYILRDLEIIYHGHEASIKRDRDYVARQAERSARAVEASAQKKARRKEVFEAAALTHLTKWLGKSEKSQLRALKSLAQNFDNESGEDLFLHGGRLLSNRWFQEALSSLRQSGKIEAKLAEFTQGK
ncbi:MAG: hypothetical protein AAGM21_02635 [Pseudomonadota bacterium]